MEEYQTLRIYNLPSVATAGAPREAVNPKAWTIPSLASNREGAPIPTHDSQDPGDTREWEEREWESGRQSGGR